MREKFSFRVISSLIVYFLNISVSFLLVSKLDIEYMGIIAFTSSLVGLFMTFIDLGFSQIYVQQNAEKNFNEYFSIFFFYKSILIVGSFVPLSIFSFFLNFESEVLTFLILKIISQIIISFSGIFLINLESKKKIMKKTLLFLFSSVVNDIFTLIIIFNLNAIPNPLILMGVMFIFGSIINLILILKMSKGEFQFKRINKMILVSYLKATKPLMIFSILSPILGNIGKILIALSYGKDTLVHYYLIDAYIISVLFLISTQISQLFATYFPREFKKNQIRNIEKITQTVERYSSILFLSIIIFVLLNGRLIFELLLPNYIDAVVYLNILVFVPYFAGINRPYASHLISSKRQRLFSNYLIIKDVIWLILILVIVPTNLFSIKMLGFGGIGLACVTLGLWMIDLFFYRYFSKNIGISFNKRIILHFLYASIAFLSTYLISRFIIKIFILNDLIYILINSILSIGIFFLELLIFKELNKKDIRFFLSLLKISIYKKSIVEELKASVNNNKE